MQVTFGLETWDLSYFNQILIFPDEYKNPFTNQMHKGETNLGGFMCFSWKDFLSGNKNTSDKINLGLHEFTHALRFNGIKGADTDYFFENYFPKWVSCATKDFVKTKNTNNSIFRKYGSVNINEFFSVTVETFFENPEQFKSQAPELFKHTSILLNQTFANGTWIINCRDYLLNENTFNLSHSFDSVFKYSFLSSSYFVGVVGFLFVSFFSALGDGYKYPPTYICFVIASLFWCALEIKFTKLSFQSNRFILQKGYFFFKNYKAESLPGAQLISLVGRVHTSKNEISMREKTTGVITVTHYKDSYFYENEIDCEVNILELEKLIAELKQNHVHVFIQSSTEQ